MTQNITFRVWDHVTQGSVKSIMKESVYGCQQQNIERGGQTRERYGSKEDIKNPRKVEIYYGEDNLYGIAARQHLEGRREKEISTVKLKRNSKKCGHDQ